ncbi:MAG: hypothetical protein DRG63_04620 [Deltaproteobacteria bacterium]|nr:MAG: hypothetical protein DRG63_04620 [Deltaproteobacteria bacterium]RLB22771.1 MAG: hypothetical protein DRG76_05865 [Deltaproteobacteria bacterium]
MIPDDLRTKAIMRARSMGMSLGQLIRIALERVLEEPNTNGSEEDPLFDDFAVFEGEVPRDISENHDSYLYGGSG